MRKYINENISKWLIAILLCGLCHTAAFAYGYNQSAQSKNWGYQPVYQSTATTSYVAAAPIYQFRTTSVLIPTQDQSESAAWMPGNSRPRRVDGWSDEDDPTGVVPDPTPIGDAPWWLMFLLAAAYSAFRHFRQRTT